MTLSTRSGLFRSTADSFNATREILSPRVRLSEIAGARLKIVCNWDEASASTRMSLSRFA